MEAKAKRKEVSVSRFFSLNGFSLKIGSATCVKGIFFNFQEKGKYLVPVFLPSQLPELSKVFPEPTVT